MEQPRNQLLDAFEWDGVVALEETKNGTPRHVYLKDAAIDALRSFPARLDTDRLFPFNPSQVTVAFRRVVKRAGIPDFRLHDLR